MLAILALYLHYLMVGTQRLQYLLLNGGALCDLLIHHLERDKVHRVRHIRAVFHTGVEIQQVVMDIETSQLEPHTELLRTDMLDGAPVVLIDGLHHQFDQYGRLVAEFLEIDIRTIARQTSLDGRKKVFHLHAQLLRLIGILHVESIERAVLANHAHIGLRLKILDGSLYTQHVFRILRLAGDDVL